MQSKRQTARQTDGRRHPRHRLLFHVKKRNTMNKDEYNNGGWYLEEIKSRQETDGERKGLYTFDGGNCDFDANGFDCRDCSLADRCPNYRKFD